MDDISSWIGRRLGKFQITAVIGQGGMGVVYEGFDPALQRAVAVKVINGEMADLESLQRFSREARATARLNHPNIVTVYDAGVHENVCYLAMELIRGASVQDRLDREGPLPWAEATRIVIDVCRGLELAHAAGLIHRDIKPANIMLTVEGTAKLADFGMVKPLHARQQELTRANTVLGTPLYMSPEQCRAEDVDERSDQYALAATLFTLVTGRPPFPADDALKVMFAHCSMPPPDPRSINPQLPVGCTAILQRALAKNRSERFKNTAEFRAALEWLLHEAPPANGIPMPLHASLLADGQRAFSLRPVALSVTPIVGAPPTNRAMDMIRKRRQPRRWFWSVTTLAACASFVLLYQQPWSDRREKDENSLAPKNVGLPQQTGSPEVAGSQSASSAPWAIEVQMRPPLIERAGMIKGFSASADGQRLAAEWGDGTIRMWAADDRLLTTIRIGDRHGPLALSANGALATIGVGNQVDVWDLASGERRTFREVGEGQVTALAVSRDNILAVGTTNELHLWRIADSGEMVPIVANVRFADGPVSDVSALAFSDDGRWLAIACRRGVAMLLDVANRQPRATTRDSAGPFGCVACSADGKLVALGRLSGGGSIWPPLSHDGPQRLTPRVPRVTVAAFDPQNRFLIFGGGSQAALYAYDFHTSYLSQIRSGPNQEWRHLCFLNGGKKLAAGDEDGTVRTWGIDYIAK